MHENESIINCEKIINWKESGWCTFRCCDLCKNFCFNKRRFLEKNMQWIPLLHSWSRLREKRKLIRGRNGWICMYYFFFNYTLILGSEKLRSSLRVRRKRKVSEFLKHQHNLKGYATFAQYQIYRWGKKVEPEDYWQTIRKYI